LTEARNISGQSNIDIREENGKKYYIVDGKSYECIEDIPDPAIREFLRNFEALPFTNLFIKARGELFDDKFIPIDPNKQEDVKKTVLENIEKKQTGLKLHHCQKCQTNVIAKKGFFGGLKCEICGKKLNI